MLVLVENVVFLRILFTLLTCYLEERGKGGEGGAGTPLRSVSSQITTHLQHIHSLNLPLCVIKRLLVVSHNTSSH